MKLSAPFIFAVAYATQALALPAGTNMDSQLIERQYVPSTAPAPTYTPPNPSSTILPSGTQTTDTPPATTSSTSPSKDNCTAVSKATFLLRAYNRSAKDHFYTTSATEMSNAVSNHGYQEGGHMGRVYTTQEAGTVPLYRLYNSSVKDHFYTTSAAQRDNAVKAHGYTSQGIAAYIYNSQICGSIPLYRLYSVSDFDHFYTISRGEVNNDVPNRGYTDQGVAGYVLPLQ